MVGAAVGLPRVAEVEEKRSLQILGIFSRLNSLLMDWIWGMIEENDSRMTSKFHLTSFCQLSIFSCLFVFYQS